MSWLAHFFGLDNLSGPFYGWWSGAGSDISELAIVGAIVATYRNKNCHVKRCWRLQWKKVPGTDHTVCRKHHPLDAPTHNDVLNDHAEANP
jgi:hypothetical protein